MPTIGVGLVAEHATDRRGLPDDALVGADDRDDVGRVLDDRGEPALDDLRGAQRDEQGLAEHRGEGGAGGAGEVGLELLVAAAGVGAEQRDHPQCPAGERAQRPAVEAAEDQAEQRQERVARRDVQDEEDRVGLDRLQREREAAAVIAPGPVEREAEREGGGAEARRERRRCSATIERGADQRAGDGEHQEEQAETLERRLRQLGGVRTVHLAQWFRTQRPGL